MTPGSFNLPQLCLAAAAPGSVQVLGPPSNDDPATTSPLWQPLACGAPSQAEDDAAVMEKS